MAGNHGAPLPIEHFTESAQSPCFSKYKGYQGLVTIEGGIPAGWEKSEGPADDGRGVVVALPAAAGDAIITK